MSTTTLDAPAATAVGALDGVRSARAAREAAEREQVFRVLEWAVVHEVEPASDRAFGWCGFGERCLSFAGPGAPQVRELAATELAAALGLSWESGRRYLGNAMEVRYRLPRLWARLASGDLTVSRAFRVAEATRGLCPEAAHEVDLRLSAFAHKIGAAQIDRAVTNALAIHDPDTAARLVDQAADGRSFTVHLDGATRDARLGIRGMSGVVEVHGLLDVRDALDLEDAVSGVAAQLVDLGSEASLDVRRSMAMGESSRAQQTLVLPDGDSDEPARPARRGGVAIFAHLRPDTPLADLATAGVTGLQTWVGQVKQWCQTSGTTVIVQPVIDLSVELVTEAYVPTAAIRRLVELRDRHCVFPWCTRPAAACDLDHVVPFDAGGPTSTHNLAPLCRRHHRAKTHTRWHYDTDSPGTYTWTSPHGLTFTVDPTGTCATTAADPPSG